MDAITYTAARANLASTMDRVCDDHAPIIITRNRDQAVVMMSLEDYESLEETAYLLRSPANARRLMESVAELEKGKGVKKKLKDKAFARSVNRDDIKQSVTELGVDMDEHIRFVIDSLRPVQEEIGLSRVQPSSQTE